jgi:sugar-phosphatase
LPLPAVSVTAEDVEHGKPAPDGFLLSAKRLGFHASDCLVFEDAPAGIAAAEAAGASIIVITAAHPQSIPAGHIGMASYETLLAEPTATGSLQLWGR